MTFLGVHWADVLLGTAILAIVPFLLAAYGGHVAAEAIPDPHKRRNVKFLFWSLFVIGIFLAFWQQIRADNATRDAEVRQEWTEALLLRAVFPPPSAPLVAHTVAVSTPIAPTRKQKEMVPEKHTEATPPINQGPCSNLRIGGVGDSSQNANCTPQNPNDVVTSYDFYGIKVVKDGLHTNVYKGSDQDEFTAYGQLRDFGLKQDWNGLIELSDREIKRAPAWPTPYMFAGVAYMQEKNSGKACEYLHKAIELAGNNPQWNDAQSLSQQIKCP
jgi:hypothetical protein